LSERPLAGRVKTLGAPIADTARILDVIADTGFPAGSARNLKTIKSNQVMRQRPGLLFQQRGNSDARGSRIF
jgi:hypothetical protein